MELDYQANEELDRYELDGIDDDQQLELNLNERMQAERLLNERDRRTNMQGKRMPAALQMDEEMSDDMELNRQLRGERRAFGGFEEEDDVDYAAFIDGTDIKGSHQEWLTT